MVCGTCITMHVHLVFLVECAKLVRLTGNYVLHAM